METHNLNNELDVDFGSVTFNVKVTHEDYREARNLAGLPGGISPSRRDNTVDYLKMAAVLKLSGSVQEPLIEEMLLLLLAFHDKTLVEEAVAAFNRGFEHPLDNCWSCCE